MDELLRLPVRHLLGEFQYEDIVGSSIEEQEPALGQAGQCLRRGIRSHDRHRVRVEGDGHEREPEFIGKFAPYGQQHLMPAMYPVEHANAQDCSRGFGCVRVIIGHVESTLDQTNTARYLAVGPCCSAKARKLPSAS